MVNPAAQMHSRCQSPNQSTAGERHGRNGSSLSASIAWLSIAVSSTTSLEINMSKPHLLLIHCSDGIPAGAKGRQRGRSFRPLVIRGGARARSVPRQSSWEAALELIDLGFLASHASYLAFMQAGLTVLESYNWTDPERTS
jgi:hypothetical protein